MKILFITPQYLNLYKEIENEMIRQGHNVSTVLYRDPINHDPYFSYFNNSFMIKIKELLFVWMVNIFDKYWENRIKNEPVLSMKYDLLFVINGEIVGKRLIDHLERNNPAMRKIFYTWDTTNYYQFDRLFKYFDKCYSFDLNDCRKHKKLKLLPIYYVEDEKTAQEVKYDVMMIGNNHDNRYVIMKKMLPAFIENKIRYFIKIICKKSSMYDNMTLREKVFLFLSKYHLYNFQLYNSYREYRLFMDDKDDFGIKSDELVEPSVYRSISAVSRCILDTQRQTQSGLTARFMWALGNGKKIITTSKYALDYDFVDKQRVLIVDEDNPQIVPEFILNDLPSLDNCSILPYRIDNWVKGILDS